MEKYYTFEVEDYIVDDFFIRWVLNNSDEDNKIWEDWLGNHPDQIFKIEQAKNIVNSIKFNQVSEVSRAEVNSFIELVKQEHLANQSVSGKNVPSLWRFNKKWIGIAASLIAVGTLFGFLVFYKNQSFNKVISAKNSESGIYHEKTNTGPLPILIYMLDGTSVILKPKSTLRYPKTFLADKREVYLSGEAFFEVHKNPRQPFLVYSGEMITEVVGTSFTVKAYKDDNDFNVIVSTGKVHVYAQPGSKDKNEQEIAKSVTLIPNQQVIYRRNKVELIKQDLPKPSILSQEETRKSFNFRGTPLTEVINTLKEAYQVDIVYNANAFSSCQLTATLYDDPLYDKLTTICKAIDANFTIVNDQIVITGRGCSRLY